MEVWIVQVGEYEDRCILAVCADLDAAVAWIKAEYPSTSTLPPHAARWSDAKRATWSNNAYEMTGTFPAQPEGEWQEDFSITPWDVVASI